MLHYKVTKINCEYAIIKAYENYEHRYKRRIVWAMKFYLTPEERQWLELFPSSSDVLEFVRRNEGVEVRKNY